MELSLVGRAEGTFFFCFNPSPLQRRIVDQMLTDETLEIEAGAAVDVVGGGAAW